MTIQVAVIVFRLLSGFSISLERRYICLPSLWHEYDPGASVARSVEWPAILLVKKEVDSHSVRQPA
jgi:hypothetical protein